MAEIQYNPDVEQIIRARLAETKEWGWENEDRKWVACEAAVRYLEANSTMTSELAHAMALKITTEIMREEEEQAAQGDETPGDDYESIETYIQELNEQEKNEWAGNDW